MVFDAASISTQTVVLNIPGAPVCKSNPLAAIYPSPSSVQSLMEQEEHF